MNKRIIYIQILYHEANKSAFELTKTHFCELVFGAISWSAFLNFVYHCAWIIRGIKVRVGLHEPWYLPRNQSWKFLRQELN